MKKLYFFIIGAVISITASSTSINSPAYQTKTPNDDIVAILDKFHASFGNRDTATLKSMLTNPGLYCGTDPTEISNDRNFVLDYLMQSYFADTATVYTVNMREIQIASDEKSAITVEQFIYPSRSKYFPTRCNIHLVKIKEKWFIDSFILSLVISPYDMERINTIMPK